MIILSFLEPNETIVSHFQKKDIEIGNHKLFCKAEMNFIDFHSILCNIKKNQISDEKICFR
jgi:hypothetical protein